MIGNAPTARMTMTVDQAGTIQVPSPGSRLTVV
jgi:hypothetical protein